jgi:hypothetical protein
MQMLKRLVLLFVLVLSLVVTGRSAARAYLSDFCTDELGTVGGPLGSCTWYDYWSPCNGPIESEECWKYYCDCESQDWPEDICGWMAYVNDDDTKVGCCIAYYD